MIFAVVLALAACTNDNEPATPDDGPVAAQVNASIEGTMTRASGTQWATGDCIGISTVSDGLTRYENFPYRYNGTVFSPADDAIYYQDAQEQVKFNAYYPFDGTAGFIPTSIEATTSADYQIAEKQPKIDFLFAEGAIASKANPTVNFTGDNAFRHCMSQITLTFIEGSDMSFPGSLTSYTLKGLKLSGAFNPQTGIAQPTETASVENLGITLSDVTVNDKRTYTASPVILFPQEMGGKIGIEVTVEGQIYKATLIIPESKSALEAGNNYTWPVTVSKTGMSVGQAQIKDWTPVQGEDTIATM